MINCYTGNLSTHREGGVWKEKEKEKERQREREREREREKANEDE